MRNIDAYKALAARLEEEEPVWGKLPAAMRFKQDLVKYFPVDEAHGLARKVLTVPATGSLSVCNVAGLHDAAQSTDGYRLLWPGGEPFSAPPTRIIGNNDHGAFTGTSRNAYVACLENCGIRGRSALIRQHDNIVLEDFEGNERLRMADNPEYDPGVLAAADDRYWMMGPSGGDRVLEVEEAFMLSGSHTLDFGHWIMEYLPRIAMAKMAGLRSIPVLIDQRIPRTLVESLDLFWPERAGTIVIPHLAPARVRRLWVAPSPMYMGFYPTVWNANTWLAMATHGPNFARLIRELLSNQPAPELRGGRLYLARKPEQPKKRLTNHQEIENIARSHGFDIVYPQDLSFKAQFELAHSADFILGPEGSAMFWSFFARPGTKVCTLSSEHTFPLADINSMMKALGLDYTILTGPRMTDGKDWLFWEDYSIDAGLLADFLASWPAS